MLQPVILCGGDGTRLWPASRKALPKQFMPLFGSTLFKDTVKRANLLPRANLPLILCNTAHRFLAAVQLQEAEADLAKANATEKKTAPRILLEPVGKNTAPAIAIAALHFQAQDPVLLVLPADHAITDMEVFAKATAKGKISAELGKLVTFGIVPTHPETGYGYIKRGQLEGEAYSVSAFVEKPSAELAEKYLQAGDYFWNSGMFMFKASVFLQELQKYAPKILEACEKAYKNSLQDLDFMRLGEEDFASSPADSVDYAVMEHTKQAAVVAFESGWSDLGSWQSLYDLASKDADANACFGDTIVADCSKSFFLSQSRLIAAVGVDNLVVVETPDAIMVATKERSQEVKKLVSSLKKLGRAEAEEHARVYRPWGSYESLICGERFQVKRIVVHEGQRLSLQKHFHRSEHWVVVRGSALVTIGEQEYLLVENQSTYIPTGAIHRLENPGKVPLEIIEIQTGSYLGEDDIVRLEDIYGR